MNKTERNKILMTAKDYFKEMVKKHISNTKKLTTLDKFNANPFLHKYLAQFAFGSSSSEHMAQALLYPRILGSSISTTFGNTLQNFCVEALNSYGSGIEGIDIEFIDAVDGRKKYCQLKAGPNTINKSQGEVIEERFKKLLKIAKKNGNKTLVKEDCVVGILYGTKGSINNFYKHIDEEYSVYAGADFWHRLTGDKNFYQDLINTFTEAANEVNKSDLVTEVIGKLAEEIKSSKI